MPPCGSCSLLLASVFTGHDFGWISEKGHGNEIVRQMVRRHYQQTLINDGAIINNVVIGDEPSLSDLINDDVAR